MRPGELSMVAATLSEAQKSLRERWEFTREQWDDAVCEAFEQQHLNPLEPKVKAVMRAMERLAQVYQSAYKECSDE